MKEPSEQPAIDALYRISRTVNRTEDPREALEIVIDEIMQVLPADKAAIELINPDSNCLEVEASRGFGDRIQNTGLKVGIGLTGWVALHGKAVNAPQVHKDPRYLEVDPSVRSEMAVPIQLEGGEVLGVVSVSSRRPAAFGTLEEKILALLTAEATRTLSRLWLIQQLREKADHLEVLIDIAQNIAAKRDLDEILQIVTTRSLEIIPSRLCAIFLLGPRGRTLTLRASSGANGSLDYDETVALEDSAIGTACRRNKSIEIFDLPKIEENHFRRVIREENLASMLACPIRFESEVIGVLNIYTDYPHRFSDDEKRIFETLASLSATAIRNARLYERIFQSEENLRRSERLTTLGLLSAEIAHEIRNPLTVIQLLFESLTLEFGAEDPRHRDVRVIREKLAQLESIVSRVLSFGKSQHEIRARYSLDKLIEDTLHLVRLKLRQSRINLDFEHGPPPGPRVDVIKGQIQQAVLNLLINATQAMPDGGRINVSTTTVDMSGHTAAVIRISDTGPGIDPAVQDSIFDSFLTGRPDGTGLGLSIVKRIVKSHNGSIEVESSSEKGTTMKITLPVATGVE